MIKLYQYFEIDKDCKTRFIHLAAIIGFFWPIILMILIDKLFYWLITGKSDNTTFSGTIDT